MHNSHRFNHMLVRFILIKEKRWKKSSVKDKHIIDYDLYSSTTEFKRKIILQLPYDRKSKGYLDGRISQTIPNSYPNPRYLFSCKNELIEFTCGLKSWWIMSLYVFLNDSLELVKTATLITFNLLVSIPVCTELPQSRMNTGCNPAPKKRKRKQCLSSQTM